MMPGDSRRSDLSRPQQNPTKLDLIERALSYVRSSVLEEVLVNMVVVIADWEDVENES